VISRMYVRCQTCRGDITARVQIGHEKAQPVTIPCPHCESEIRFRLLLDDPPNVGVAWDENCEEGEAEGMIVNVGADFAIAKDKIHEDQYFPSFDMQPLLKKRIAELREEWEASGEDGPRYMDTTLNLGGVPYAQDAWRTVHKVWQLHRSGRADLRDAQIELFWNGADHDDRSVQGVIGSFFASFLAPREDDVLPPLLSVLDEAYKTNPSEVLRLAGDLEGRWIADRTDANIDLLHEFFKGYGDFSQTLVYAKMGEPLAADRHASSSDFAATRMFYGNAFELLGSHLDFAAALLNILEGRAYDQLSKITLAAYRTTNKAGRALCLAPHPALSKLAAEYDSIVRNASHHRSFKLDSRREVISYRSGGTGAQRAMSYAEYLYRCNKLLLQCMALACLELALLGRCGKEL
jgi:hypothetical protein